MLFVTCSYGYDPLGLGKDPSQVETYRAYELIHARWAMLAAAGIIIPEGLQVIAAGLGCHFGRTDTEGAVKFIRGPSDVLTLSIHALCIPRKRA